jgi:hypothetical protein
MKAYRIVFECPKGGHYINLQRKLSQPTLSATEATAMFRNVKICCTHHECGWRGKASKTKVVQIESFNWILAPASVNC